MSERLKMPARKIVFVVPPYLGDKVEAIRPTKLRSFFAFPYGVLCLASYINRATSDAHEIKIIDLNRYGIEQGLMQFKDLLNSFQPDIVGISVMFDVSYKYVAGLATTARTANPEVMVILGGAAVTTVSGLAGGRVPGLSRWPAIRPPAVRRRRSAADARDGRPDARRPGGAQPAAQRR